MLDGLTSEIDFAVSPLSKHKSDPNQQQIQTGPNTAGTKRAEQPHGLSCVARFERSAGVFADRGDLTNQFADRAAS